MTKRNYSTIMLAAAITTLMAVLMCGSVLFCSGNGSENLSDKGSDAPQITCDWDLIEEDYHDEIYAGVSNEEGALYTVGGNKIVFREGTKREVVFSGVVSLKDIWRNSKNEILAVGVDAENYDGLIIKCEKRDCHIVERVGKSEFSSIWGDQNGDMFISGVGSVEGKNGTFGIVIKYDGKKAEVVYQRENSTFQDIWVDAAGETVVVAGSYSDGINNYGIISGKTGAQAWTEFYSNGEYVFSSIWGKTQDNIFAIGSLNRDWFSDEDSNDLSIVVRYDGSGWQELPTKQSADVNFRSVWGAPNGEIYFGGANWNKEERSAKAFIGEMRDTEIETMSVCIEDNAVTNFCTFDNSAKIVAFTNEGEIAAYDP